MAKVVFYISGHGFGHASRNIEVINALLAAAPSTSVEVRTSAPRWLFDLTVRGHAGFTSVTCDVGVVRGLPPTSQCPRGGGRPRRRGLVGSRGARPQRACTRSC